MPPRRELVTLVCLVAMELLAGFPLVVGLDLVGAVGLHYLLFWALLAAGWTGIAVALGVQPLRLRYPHNRVAILGGGALTTGVLGVLAGQTLAGFLVAGFLLAGAFWRGLVVTREEVEYQDVQRRFALGFGALLIGIDVVVARGAVFQRPVWQAVAFAGVGYVILALGTLGLARLEEMREPGAGSAALLAVATQLGVLLVLSFGALELFSLDIAGWLGNLLAPVWDAIATAIALGLTLLLTPVFWLINVFHPHLGPLPHNPFLQHRPKRTFNGRRPQSHPANRMVETLIGVIMIAAAVVAAMAVIWRALPRVRRQQRPREVGEERRPLLSPGEMWRALIAWLAGLFRRGVVATGQAAGRARRRVLGPSYPADPVRRVYAQLLYRAARHGLERQPTVTPAEFQQRLEAWWPESADDFAAVTRAYIRRRYGDVTPDEAEIRRVREHWRNIRTAMRTPHEA